MSKNILVYVTQLLKTGGIENHIFKFCDYMAEEGVNIDLVVANSQIEIDIERRLRKKCRKIFLPQKDGSLNELCLLITLIKRLKILYDALYTNGQGQSIYIISKLVCYKTWVHHHHKSGDVEDQATWSYLYEKAMDSADTIIACSNRNAKSIAEVRKRSIDVIPVFSRRIFLRDKGDYNSINKRKLRFGYYGRLIPEKGIDILAKLSEEPECKDIEFHIWGEGKAYPASYFYEYKNLRYHGVFKGIEELKDVILFLDSYLLLSTESEGLPVSLLETMSAGLPWLATKRGGIPDIACDDKATRIIPSTSNYEEIKREVLSLASDIRNGIITKEKQCELYDQKFSKEALFEEWKEVLNIG